MVADVGVGVDAALEAELEPEEPKPGKRPRSWGWDAVGADRAVVVRARRVREYFILLVNE